MITRPAGSSMYSVFCGSSGRQSALVEAASTSAAVAGFFAAGAAGVAAPTCAASSSVPRSAAPAPLGETRKY